MKRKEKGRRGPRDPENASSIPNAEKTAGEAALGFVLFDPDAPYLVREPCPLFPNDAGP